jgi:hypothetical protein
MITELANRGLFNSDRVLRMPVMRITSDLWIPCVSPWYGKYRQLAILFDNFMFNPGCHLSRWGFVHRRAAVN